MTERYGDSVFQSYAARAILALLLIFALAVLGLPNPLGNATAEAQQSPSPGGPTIQFVNPSGTTANSDKSGPGREVSNRNDGTDTSYHLVAWVSALPSSPTVEFKYQSGDDPDVTIAQGTQRGSDTFDAFWSLGTLPDGDYTLKAILYSSGIEISRDEEEVIVNNDTEEDPGELGPASENQGQTVEITYPQIAGPFGLFRKPGTNDPHAGVLDVTVSEGTTAVRAYYTTSAPGTEPTWVRCSTPAGGEPQAGVADGVRCTLAEGTNPSSVTAVAAASGDAAQEFPGDCAPPPDECGEPEDSGDAHRAAPYIQSPSSVTVAPATQRKDDTDTATAGNQFPCSDVIAATVLDQSGRKVVGANVDVHAAGPTDNLFFDDSDTTETSAHQPPDKGSHITEVTANCEDTNNPKGFNTAAAEAQGEHEVAGEGDIKHVESAPAGTNDAGQWRFRLYNRSSSITGVTQFTAWYDRDDDDLKCSGEPRGDGAIGWGADAGSPSGLPDDTTNCPEPSASPTGTSSPTQSPTSTGSPTGSPTGTAPPGTSRTVTFVASDAKVEFGDQVTLSGRIVSSDSSCTDNEFIRIRQRIHGTRTFADRTSVMSDDQGAFEATIRGRRNADYQAIAPAHDNCADGASDPITVLVKVKVSSRASESRLQRGERVRFVGGVKPNHKGTRVVLQRKKGQRWVKVAATKLNKRSRYRIAIEADWNRRRVFRVRWKSQDADHQTGKSKNMRVVAR